ncbi:MAG: diadenylate cyclase CdaA [Candidatus Obscuribacterales bacterium]|nr:diadenylate cyclase CdaA [Candidatus Obscuribacterales bacterium]
MDDIWQQLESFTSLARHIDGWDVAKIAFQIFIIGYALAWTWRRIRKTQAERLLKGLLVLAMVWMLSWAFGLTIISNILREMVPVLVIAVVIVFQPELRRGLVYLGRTTFKVDLSLSDTQNEKAKEVISQIISAVRELSKHKTGALIVVEPPEGERDYVSPGTTLNAEVTASLLLSIFNTNSPLHDGAVVIRENKILAAGVILPMTNSQKLSHRYGTRHRAALGLSEIYDGLCIVASEETGAISAASRGMLVRYNSADELSDALLYIYHQLPDQKTETALQSFFKIFSLPRKSATVTVDNHPRRRATDFAQDEKVSRHPENLGNDQQAETA